LVYLSCSSNFLETEHTDSVIKYDISSAVLTLEHRYPPGSDQRALVNVRLLLETLKSTDTRLGEWVNVIGYVTEPFSPGHSSVDVLKNTTSVQAIILWSAGSVKLEEYEKTLNEMLLAT
jgi:hypothetical protein